MSWTAMQMPGDSEELYGSISSMANKIRNMVHQWQKLYDFLDDGDASDLTGLEIDTATQVDIGQFKTLLGEMIDLNNNTAVTPTNDPVEVLKAVSRL